jgi:hypothetical protein
MYSCWYWSSYTSPTSLVHRFELDPLVVSQRQISQSKDQMSSNTRSRSARASKCETMNVNSYSQSNTSFPRGKKRLVQIEYPPGVRVHHELHCINRGSLLNVCDEKGETPSAHAPCPVHLQPSLARKRRALARGTTPPAAQASKHHDAPEPRRFDMHQPNTQPTNQPGRQAGRQATHNLSVPCVS